MIRSFFRLEPLWAAVTILLAGLPPASVSTICSVVTISVLLLLPGAG